MVGSAVRPRGFCGRTKSEVGRTTHVQLYNYPMPEYRRSKVEGGTYFFTVVMYLSSRSFLMKLPAIFYMMPGTIPKKRFPFETWAVCLLPDPPALHLEAAGVR